MIDEDSEDKENLSKLKQPPKCSGPDNLKGMSLDKFQNIKCSG